MHDGKELVLQPVGVGEPRGDLKHQRQTLLLLAAQSFHRLPESLFCSFFRTCSIAQDA